MSAGGHNKLNLAGKRFDRLLIIEDAGRDKWGAVMLKCLCNPEFGGCGNIKIILSKSLRSGHTKSCGCLRRELTSKRSKNRTDMKGKDNPMFGKKRPDLSKRNYKHGHAGTKSYNCAKTQKRNAKKLNQTPSDADINTIQEIYKLCAELNGVFGQGSFHVDHIQPLGKGGLHHEDNLQIIPCFENLRKTNKDPRDYYGRHYDFMVNGHLGGKSCKL